MGDLFLSSVSSVERNRTCRSQGGCVFERTSSPSTKDCFWFLSAPNPTFLVARFFMFPRYLHCSQRWGFFAFLYRQQHSVTSSRLFSLALCLFPPFDIFRTVVPDHRWAFFYAVVFLLANLHCLFKSLFFFGVLNSWLDLIQAPPFFPCCQRTHLRPFSSHEVKPSMLWNCFPLPVFFFSSVCSLYSFPMHAVSTNSSGRFENFPGVYSGDP